MTVKDMRETVCDREFFPDKNQEVLFKFGNTVLKVKGTTVPGKGPAVVELTPAPLRKFMFSLKFEANPVIEAASLEEAETKACEMLRPLQVGQMKMCKASGVKIFTPDSNYEPQEPYFLEEVEG